MQPFGFHLLQAKSAFLHICFDFLSPHWNPKLELRIQEFPRRESSSLLTSDKCCRKLEKLAPPTYKTAKKNRVFS